MGLLDVLLGKTNPVSMFVDSNRNAVHGAAAGFGRGTNIGDGLSFAAQGAQAGSPLDDQVRANEEEKTQRQDQINQTMKFLQVKFPDLAQAVTAGLPIGDAWNEAFKRSAPGYGAKADKKPIEINGQLVDPDTYKVLGDFRTPDTPKPQSPPNGYRTAADGTSLEFVPGGPADPSTAGKTTEATRRNQQLATVIDPELKSLIGDGTTPGTFDALANGWDMARSNTPGAQALGQGPSAEYQQAQNSLKTIVASYLYSVSGATANPGEVQNQVDVLTPKLNEDPKTTAAKKARLIQMVEAVKAAATGKPINIDDPSGAAAPAQNDPLGIR